MRTTTAMCTGHSFPASTITLCSGRLAASANACASWFNYVAAAFLLARSHSHSPSLYPRSRPVPFAPLALVVLLPLLRALCLRCRPETLK
ncbi:hypothetical protein DFH08DRAFT_399689 [Mycena albidolilacea]|uniref:Uncharacterized protein n=1 Tax=Mycena albidolilacea TaxID=1033008 RepID=A0AAD6ZDH0_9AGAR|nr:hypothetical protein DFH08DRAFT_399689 [Mycena albidolilacea]